MHLGVDLARLCNSIGGMNSFLPNGIHCFYDGSEVHCLTLGSKISNRCLIVLGFGDHKGHSIQFSFSFTSNYSVSPRDPGVEALSSWKRPLRHDRNVL